MSLCKLVVLDYLDNKPLESFGEGYREGDILFWENYVKEDLAEGRKTNWWYHFNNEDFLAYLKNLRKQLPCINQRGN